MKKLIQSAVVILMTTLLFSCGHMHHHDGKDATHSEGCACESSKSDTTKTDSKKETCELCKKGS